MPHATTETRRRLSLIAVLAVIGPGVIAASAGNDAGGISTYSVAGADFGYEMLWLIPIMTLSLVVVQEMAVRMGAVTGKGFAALIRERFGIRPSLFAMVALVISNAATSVSEFAGIASAMEILGVSRYIAVPVAALAVWLLVVRGSYRRVEKIMLALSAVFIAYVISAFLVGPDWAEVARATVVPSVELSSAFVVLSIAMVGTTIAPWMQFFVQSNVVDKGLTARDLKLQRIDVISGTAAAGFIAWCIVLTTGTVLHGSGVGIETAADAAWALAPVAGAYATQLFALGLLGASLLAACVLPLTASYAVCEAFGFERGIDRSWAEAPVFNGIYTFVIVFGAAFILIPGLNLISIMVFSQVVGGILLPFLLIYMMIIVNDRRIMGRYVNRRGANALGWATIVVVIALTAALLVMTLLGVG
ncbi:MAG TPA: Nramp family divalent metal transporter [Coriobacteriia bacterium]|nr:Nramp family divalent metal transporter [Coriobacteriia bacterium]